MLFGTEKSPVSPAGLRGREGSKNRLRVKKRRMRRNVCRVPSTISPAAGRPRQALVAPSCHLPPHYQLYCVGKDTIQNQGKAGSWKTKKPIVSGIHFEGIASSLSP